jgi:hypothetical protein
VRRIEVFLWLLSLGCTVERSGLSPRGAAIDSGAADARPARRDSGETPTDASSTPDGPRDAWLAPTHAHRITILVPPNDAREHLVDFVLPVHLTRARFDYASAASDGTDLRFHDADGSLLSHEVERWDTTSESVIWLRVPDVPPTGHAFAMYFGGPSDPGRDARATWPTRYLTVHHFAALEHVGDQVFVRDSTANRIDGSFGRTPSSLPRGVPGALAAGLAFDGTATAVLELRDSEGSVPETLLPENEARTYEAWFRAEAGDQMPLLYMEGCCRGWGMTLDPVGAVNGYVALADDTCCDNPRYYVVRHESPSPRDGAWHSVTFVADRPNSRLALYVDGVMRHELTSLVDGRTSEGGRAKIGSIWDDSQRLLGSVDEVRISRGAMSSTWIATQHAAARDELLEYRAIERR